MPKITVTVGAPYRYRRPGLLAFLAGGTTQDAKPARPRGNRQQRRAGKGRR